MKERPEWSEIPILICTSQSPAKVKELRPTEGLAYVSKPIRMEQSAAKGKGSICCKKKGLAKP